jgi:hypothetical protein
MRMRCELWRIDPDWLMAYTEDRSVWLRAKRYYPDFIIVADYFKKGRLIGLQFKIPSNRKRAARHLFGVNVSA